MRTSILPPLAFALACSSGGKDGREDDTASDDTGDTGTPEEGCITVDGGGGYAWINDAIAAASDGSVIALCAADSHEESVVVDKAVSIVGPGTDAFVLVPPSNMPGITFAAGGGSVSGISISSTRAGIEVEAADGVTISDVQVIEAGTWGIRATESSGTVLAGVVLMGNGYGGVEIDGGDAEITGSTLAQNMSYGVFAAGSAEVTLTENDISSSQSLKVNGVLDGINVYADQGSRVSTSGNAISGAYLVNVYADQGDLALADDVITGSLYGIAAFLGEATASGLEVTGAEYMGAWFASNQPVSVSSSTFTGDPKTSISVAYDEWAGDNPPYGCGLVVASDEVAIADVAVEGFNNCGVLVDAYDTAGTADIQRVTVTGVGRYGMLIEEHTATVADSEISGTRDPDDVTDTDCYYVNYIAGLYAPSSTVTWTGGSVHDNEGWGMSSVYGRLDIDGAAVHGDECSGIVTYGSSLAVTGSAFSDEPPYGSINSNYSTGDVISGNTFTDNQYFGTYVEEYDYWDTHGYRVTYTYYDTPINRDINVYDAASVELTDNTFTTGDAGAAISGTDVVISGNTWTDYRSDVLYVSAGSNPGTFELDDNVIEGFDGVGIACSSANLEIDNLTMTDGGTNTWAYDYLYEDTTGYTYSSSVSSTFSYYGMYLTGCTVVARDVEISSLDGPAMYVYSYSYDGSYEFEGLDISDVGNGSAVYYGAISFQVYKAHNDLVLIDSRIADVHVGSAIEIEPYDWGTDYDATVSVYAVGLEIDGAAEYGITTTTSRVDVELSGARIENATLDGIHSTSSQVVIDGSTVETNGASGIWLSATTGTVTGNTVTGNATYGMECESATIDDCTGNDLSGNASGEQTGCDAACGVEANP